MLLERMLGSQREKEGSLDLKKISLSLLPHIFSHNNFTHS